MKRLTIRNVPEDLAAALVAEKERLRLPLEETVIELLRRSLGIARSNGLARLAGTWTAEDLAEFDAAVAPFGQIDEELW